MTALTRRQIGFVVASAAAAGITAGWVTGKSRLADRAQPPAGNFLDVNGVRLHYVEQGNGPPVVLLHGNAVPLQDIVTSGLVAELATRHRVVVFDRPGFGSSARPRHRLWTPRAQAALLHEALGLLGISNAVVLGHSLGALVALELALIDESAVRKLVLVSGYYFPSARVDVAMAAPQAIPLLGDILRYTTSPLLARLTLKRVVRKMFAPEAVPPGYLTAVPRELIVRPSQIRADSEDAVFMIPAAMRLKKRYATLDVPVVLLAGADDKVVDPTDHSVRLHRALPDSQLEVIPGAGHMLHHAHHRRVAEAIAG